MTAHTRILAVDFGNVRIGLAISDPEGRIASPLTTLRRQNRERDAQFFRDIVAEQDIGQIVLGLPVHLDGHEGVKAQEARAYGAWLQAETGVPVIFHDERFTSVEAESYLWSAGLTHKRRQERRDRVAAQILLQAYLDAGRPTEPSIRPLDDP